MAFVGLGSADNDARDSDLTAHRLRVLVFDGDIAVRHLMASALRQVSEVVETETAEAALTNLAAPDNVFDAVFVSCLRSHEDPDYAAVVELVRAVFRQSQPISVIVIGDRADAVHFRGDLLLTGLREVVATPVRRSSLIDALLRVAREYPRQRPPSVRNLAAIRRILAYLEEHREIPRLVQLAQMTTMSRSYFSRTFHAVAGVPLRQYRRDLRLKRACRLLLASNLSLTNIASEVGFYDLPHFNRMFRQRLGVSPREFRTGDTTNGSVHGPPLTREA